MKETDNENEIAVKPKLIEIHEAVETLVNISTFTESGSIRFEGVVLNLVELNHCMRQMGIMNFFKNQ